VQRIHADLARYFRAAPLDRKLDEYPHHLSNAGFTDELAKALCDVELFPYAVEANRADEIVGHWRALGESFEVEPRYERAIETVWTADGESELVGRLLARASRIFGLMGLHAAAVKYGERGLAILEKNLGDDERVALNRDNLAGAYLASGRVREAEQANRAAQQAARAKGDLEGFERAAFLNNQAMILKQHGRFEEAIPLAEQALRIAEETTGTDSVEQALMLGNLSTLYLDVGRFADALPLATRALAIDEKTKGPDHRDVATHLNNLGHLHMHMKRHQSAQALFERALTISERGLGPRHPDVATVVGNLGRCAMFQNDHERAIAFFERALAIEREVLGDQHPSTAYTSFCLSYDLAMVGRLAEAANCCERAVRTARTLFGPNHPQTRRYIDRLEAILEAHPSARQ